MRGSQPYFAKEVFRIELPVDAAVPDVAMHTTVFLRSCCCC
jgi:hypothetical protein